MSPSPSNPMISETLRNDLSIVLPSLTARAPLDIASDILDKAVDLLSHSRAPAIVGLSNLSIEALREVIPLAERIRGRLLPLPTIGNRISTTQPVTESATLGHLFACDMIVWVGCDGGSGPVAQRIAERQLLGAFVDSSLDVVLRLRDDLTRNPTAGPFGACKRVAVVLKPDCDPRVISQWHKLAAQIQSRTRLCVFSLPANSMGGNERGVIETITWQTGVSPIGGGIDFSDGNPRWCPPADVLLKRGAIDLILDTSTESRNQTDISRTIPRIAINGNAIPGTAAQVMRCDGIVLWLCDDPATAAPDPAVTFFATLMRRIGTRT
ncbi:MAG: hypothetical protein IT444_05400 [Phycisphaeraceae bacterium]|nr:hypothetical protein [Phycisphaeraceae bacterium]